MEVLFFDPNPVCTPEVGVRRLDSLAALAEAADVLSVHADLNPGNERLIDGSVLERMGRQSVLVNTARGQLLDEHALLAALRSQHIAGAALDVIWNEGGFGKGHPLLDYARRYDNLILTPHIGGQTEEAVAAADRYILKKIAEVHGRIGNERRAKEIFSEALSLKPGLKGTATIRESLGMENA